MVDVSGVWGCARGMRDMMVSWVSERVGVAMYGEVRTDLYKFISGYFLNIENVPKIITINIYRNNNNQIYLWSFIEH